MNMYTFMEHRIGKIDNNELTINKNQDAMNELSKRKVPSGLDSDHARTGKTYIYI